VYTSPITNVCYMPPPHHILFDFVTRMIIIDDSYISYNIYYATGKHSCCRYTGF
jgi:hypothetical protein